MEFLWEIGVGADPLTVELADLRGYGLYNDTQSITLEVPVLSIGYTYQVRDHHSHMADSLWSVTSGRCRTNEHVFK